jgi:AcrR family transcriptional regulator
MVSSMPRDSAATAARILAAAVDEFAAHGLAGARIDHIAERAEANKRSIYVYFGDKEGLFRAALHHVITELNEAVPVTEDDLPGYAGRLFDYHLSRPEALRLSLWRHLERPKYGPDSADLYAGKIRAMKRAGARDLSATRLPPTDLIVLITGLPTSWIISPDDLLTADGGNPHSKRRLVEHRAAIVEAARRIVGQEGRNQSPTDLRPESRDFAHGSHRPGDRLGN